MKQKRPFSRPYGLRLRFAISLILSALFFMALFWGISNLLSVTFENYFEKSGYEERRASRQEENLQKYIDKYQISSKDIEKLEKWKKRQPVVLMEIFDNDECIYTSLGYLETEETIFYDTENKTTLHLADKDVEAVIYSDFTYQIYLIDWVISLVFSLTVFVILFLMINRRIITYICRLNKEVQILETGNLEFRVSEEGNDEITDLAKSMNRMRISLQQQLESEQKLQDMNKRLVTQMSHDLRTPLTGIMLYLDIIRFHRYNTEEELQEYLKKIDEKALHMKQISDNLFNYSLEKAQTLSKPETMEEAFGKHMLAFVDELRDRGYSIESSLAWSMNYVQVKEDYIQRIFENLISNISKYASIQENVIIDMMDTGKYCGFSVLNGCQNNPANADSNGIGLESIQTMMKDMNGICTIEQMESVFMITLLFPKQ